MIVCDVHKRARARAHSRTHTYPHAQMPNMRHPPSITRTRSLCCCQIKAWRAGHKGECVPAAFADASTTAITADQNRLTEILVQFAGADDWRGVAAQEDAATAVAAAVRTAMPCYAAWVYFILGRAYHMLGNFSKSLELHKVLVTIKREMGDRAGEGEAYGNIGSAYISQGDMAQAIKYHTEHLMIAKEVGDRPGEGCGYEGLGSAHDHLGDYAQAIKYHMQYLVIAKELGDRAGEGRAYGNIGNLFRSQGDFSKAFEYLQKHLDTAKELGDLKWEGRAHGSIGNAHERKGDFSRALENHTKHLAMAKKIGDQVGEGRAYDNLGTCYIHLNELDKAIACFQAQHAMGITLDHARFKSSAALNMGISITLQIQEARQSTATRADQAPGPHSHSSASACLNGRVREAAKWLQVAFDYGLPYAKLHLAHLTIGNASPDDAVAHLQEYLSCIVQGGRNLCSGCWQIRGAETPMLKCSGCRVARFCSKSHQKMASNKAAHGGSLWTGRHKDMCGVLGRWREVVKCGAAPDSCTEELLAFLQRENA